MFVSWETLVTNQSLRNKGTKYVSLNKQDGGVMMQKNYKYPIFKIGRNCRITLGKSTYAHDFAQDTHF